MRADVVCLCACISMRLHVHACVFVYVCLCICIRDVPIIGLAIILAADILFFTVSVIGTACTRTDISTDNSACKLKPVKKLVVINYSLKGS